MTVQSRRVILLYGVSRGVGQSTQWLRGPVWTRDVTGASRYGREVALKVALSAGGMCSVLPPEAFPDPQK